MRYRQTVTFRQPETAQIASGQPTYTYANVDGLTDLPATVVATTIEKRGDRLTLIEDAYQIVVSGDHPEITTGMAVLDGTAVYDVLSVAPTYGKATIVTAQRVAI